MTPSYDQRAREIKSLGRFAKERLRTIERIESGVAPPHATLDDLRSDLREAQRLLRVLEWASIRPKSPMS
ncbi:MAG: hypothetical protein KDC27_18885 [Acidobacteria bacterium]|nr:hypothetical protein [Acidobacteriota bacterium]